MIKIEVEKKYLNVDEVAHYAGISRMGVYKLMKEGKFPKGTKIGNSRRWNLDELNEFLKGCTEWAEK